MSGGGGADSGQAANRGGGWLSAIVPDGWSAPWASGDAGALASGGVAPVQGTAPIAGGVSRWVERLADSAADSVAGDLPGYGSLWSIEGGAVQVTSSGKLVLIGAGLVVAFLVFGGGGRRGRW